MRSRCKVTKIDPKFAKSWAIDWLASLSSSQRVTKTTANQQIHGAAYHWRRLFLPEFAASGAQIQGELHLSCGRKADSVRINCCTRNRILCGYSGGLSWKKLGIQFIVRVTQSATVYAAWGTSHTPFCPRTLR